MRAAYEQAPGRLPIDCVLEETDAIVAAGHYRRV